MAHGVWWDRAFVDLFVIGLIFDSFISIRKMPLTAALNTITLMGSSKKHDLLERRFHPSVPAISRGCFRCNVEFP